jgi:hypothetical protein
VSKNGFSSLLKKKNESASVVMGAGTSTEDQGGGSDGPIAIGGGISLRRHKHILQQQQAEYQTDLRRQQQRDWATVNEYKRQTEQLNNDLILAVTVGGCAVLVTAVGMFVWGRGARTAASELRNTINHERRKSVTELEIMRKRNAEEMAKCAQFANQGFAKTLLDVSDNLVRF